jgi:ribosomal protein L37AE/L43A
MAKLADSIHECPNCGSSRTNKVSKTNSYCVSCGVEFDKIGGIFTIQWDGELVPYYENEFANII